MHFSRRLPSTLAPTALSAALEAAAASGAIDLRESNPTAVELDYPADVITPLGDGTALRYVPEPLGSERARTAIAAYLGAVRGVDVAAEDLFLTASTSEAYSFLLRLFCDPGDAVVVAAPGYPLLSQLAEIEGVRLSTHRSIYERRWRLDVQSLANACAAGVRWVSVVHPNNPTGDCLDADTAVRVARICIDHDVPLVVDEVFAPYGATGCVPSVATLLGFGAQTAAPPAVADLTLFILDGLSKGLLLPQLKLAWTAAWAPPERRAAIRERWAYLADAFLSVGTPVQLAAPELLARADELQPQLRQRIAANAALLEARLRSHPELELLHRQAGWYASLRLPRIHDEETWATRLAEVHRVVVQPGFFYDFEAEGLIVLSLIVEPRRFGSGVERLLRGIEAELRATS